MSEYISIAEFSKKAGVSKQAIYKRLNKDLKPWIKVDNSRKTIDIKALDLFRVDIKSTDSTEISTITLLKQTIDRLEKELDSKEEQLKIKDKQIEELNERLKESSQSLRAITHTELLEATTSKEDQELPEKIIEVEQPKKKGFFDFFRKE